jgi:hypothetical protein
MIARNVCPSTTSTSPTLKVERAVTFASRIRSAVRYFFFFSAAAAQQQYYHETDWPIIGLSEGLGWGNAMQEMLFNAHLAYLSKRT